MLTRTRAKVLLSGCLTGVGTGLGFILVHDAFTTDNVFQLWEFVLSLWSPGLIACFVAVTIRSSFVIALSIAYLTLLIPVLGASFGASGAEPLWQFGLIGLVGGLIWSVPFALTKK